MGKLKIYLGDLTYTNLSLATDAFPLISVSSQHMRIRHLALRST